MKKFINLLWLVAVFALTGCVNTITENQPGSKPAYRDRVESRFQKPVDQVFEASKRALTRYGNITSEGKVTTTTNQVRVAEGLVNGRRVYMRIEEVDPRVTSAVVQVRTGMGGTDLRIAADLARQIALELE